MPDVRRAYDAYEAYEVWKGIFLTPSTDAFTPSTACGRSPSLEEGGLWDSPVKAYGLAVDCI